MSEDIRRKMRELEKQVEHHMHLYYDLDAPELEDYEYDRLIHSLMDLEEQYPQYASPNSPTKRVGGKAQNTFREVTHKVQMGSLQDVFSTDELRAFDARVREEVPNPTYVVEQKIDGLSVVKNHGAFYVFPKLDVKKFNITNDKKFAFDLLHEKHIFIVPGSGFDWHEPDHFRIVMLPEPNEIAQAIRDIGDFLNGYWQKND
jgi:hypothetical protein